jgi:hypothetical protein
MRKHGRLILAGVVVAVLGATPAFAFNNTSGCGSSPDSDCADFVDPFDRAPDVVAVPEPSALLLLAAGFGVLAYRRLRRDS